MTDNLTPSIRIVFDTNVLISALVFSGFAEDVYDHCALHFELYTSEWILSEFDEKMERKFGYSPERRKRIIETVRERHIVITPTNDMPVNSSDPNDNNVLRAALFIEAHFLITGDAKHLQILKRVGNTEIISPRMFSDRYIA
ncbi:putative toxin-antitoxin system toxin component, PIN family [Spirosoma foliorum]|uniref:Putative toxin-antitoxin system toxin component, PIN family n=1 Tax=Spirosoma foliorum TaxID=2710596 RepID=A0A7G5GR73_9BACT|nr:putative toxin-antitoxin system toxin component, PIN family [Spirosoma foliorum]QMW01365.1 putative toxin-antitoxin system toxin component, PIN family [Spirosoma foliorum]